jgi:hypothetical protein
MNRNYQIPAQIEAAIRAVNDSALELGGIEADEDEESTALAERAIEASTTALVSLRHEISRYLRDTLDDRDSEIAWLRAKLREKRREVDALEALHTEAGGPLAEVAEAYTTFKAGRDYPGEKAHTLDWEQVISIAQFELTYREGADLRAALADMAGICVARMETLHE